MRKITKGVYLFDELSEDAKKRAINDHYNINTDYDWYDTILFDFIDDCKKIGISVNYKDISFSGFYSQGDGASFVGEVHNVPMFLQNLGAYIPKNIADCIDIRFVRISHSNCHEYTCKTELEAGFDEYGADIETEYSEILEIIEKRAEQVRLDLCKKLYRDLEQAYEDLTSDEGIASTLIASEYEFYENGERYC